MKKPTDKYGIQVWKDRCDLICSIDRVIRWETEEIVLHWLAMGPPDGICEEYENSKDWQSTELADYCLEDETFFEWLECSADVMAWLKENEYEL